MSAHPVSNNPRVELALFKKYGMQVQVRIIMFIFLASKDSAAVWIV